MTKRALFYVIGLMTLAACSTDEAGIDKMTYTPSETEVSINVAAPVMNSDSRGSGTVGSTNAAQNQWNGQVVNVYMLNKGTLDCTTVENSEGQKVAVFENTPVVTPDGSSIGIVKRSDYSRTYYPLNGSSDFWGYYTNGAETGAPVVNGTQMYIPFKIDGSQDIMVGRTDNSKVLAQAVASDKPITEKDLYSAKSASWNINPTLEFKHMLTRLVFKIRAYEKLGSYSEEAPRIKEGDIIITNNQSLVNQDLYFGLQTFGVREVSTGVYIDYIMVESPSSGKLVFAYSANDADKEQKIIWDNDPQTKNFTLKQRQKGAKATDPLVDMTMSLVPKDEYRQLGEALLLAPSTRYNLRVGMHQYKEVQPGKFVRQAVVWPNEQEMPHVIDLTSVAGNSTFTGNGAAGYSYEIRLGISGLEAIDLNGSLEKWEDGGSVTKPIE